MGRTIDDIEVVDVEKRKIPSKHYVYIVHVTWSDHSTNVIYRRYSRFFDFQNQLTEMYPEQSGALEPSERIIPFLPGKKFFGRSHIRDVALKRMAPIAEYCKAIVKLPRKISQCQEVLQFFEIEPDDIDPPKGRKASMKAKKISKPKPLEVYIAVSEYKKQEKGEIALQAGMLVEIVEKTETGWWFVNVEDEQGWVPSTCLEREDGIKEDSTVRFDSGKEQQYLCTEEFRAEGEDELSMDRGAVVDVIEKNLEGWWMVRYNGREGFVPATFLIKTESFKILKKEKNKDAKKKKSSCESVGCLGGPIIVRSLMEVSDLLKEDSDTVTTKVTPPIITTHDTEDDEDDFDDSYDVPVEEDAIYTIQELSNILKEGKRGTPETEKIYESIQTMKSRSLKRYGSTRPPPRPSMRQEGFIPMKQRPPLMHAESLCMEYVTIAAFSDAVGDGISFLVGQSVKVLEKSENGWWYIGIDNKEGWAPASYIESVVPAVNKACATSPLELKKTSSPVQSMEDLTNEDTDPTSKRRSTSDAIGGLAQALKHKLNKGSKQPPTPPKKDFLTDNGTNEKPTTARQSEPQKQYNTGYAEAVKPHDTTTHSEIGKLPIPGGFALPLKPVLKKSPNRNMQGPPPVPPGKTTGEPKPPPVPPGKTVSDPKPPLVPPGKATNEQKPSRFSAAVSATPTKVDTKPDCRPKPLLPVKTDLKRINDKSKPVLPVKHDTRQSDVKSNSPVAVKPSDNESHGDGRGSVAGIAGALKARFEAIDQDKNLTDTQKPKPNVNPKVNLKPVPNQSKPTLPVSVATRKFSPGVPFKPSNLNQTPHMPKPSWAKSKEEPTSPSATKPSWAKNKEESASPIKPSWAKNNADQVKSKNQHPQLPNKPSWAKNKEESTLLTASKPSWAKISGDPVQSRKSELGEDGDGENKVIDLSNVLKAKFENRKTQGDTGEPDIIQRDSKPAPAAKSPLKPFQKPQRPGIPPLPKGSSHQPQGRRLPNTPVGRTSSPVLTDSSSLDPKKYSLRPLPPQPKSPLKQDIPSTKHTSKPLPSFPGKPKSSIAIGNLKTIDLGNNTDSDDESKPAGVPNLANAMKAKLGAIGSPHIQTSVSPSKPKQKFEQTTIEHSNIQSDIENNNAAIHSSSDDNVYCAIADFAGDNEGEIKLVIGQEVQLLETADGWWYVSKKGDEGWAPSSYLEKMEPGQGWEPTASETVNSKQTMYRMCSNFVAENEGELSVDIGQEVNVVEMPDREWWFVEVDGQTGWIPSSFLEEVTI